MNEVAPADNGTPDRARFRRTLLIAAAAGALLALAIYLPALGNGFVEWDDPAYILNNPHIRSLNGSSLRWMLLEFYSANWHPLTWLSHALDFALWGLNPLGHHLTSILLHAMNTALVVLVGGRVLTLWWGEPGDESGSDRERDILFAAGMAGAVFAVHPLHVESVAWVSERKDLLCALFFLASLLSYTTYAGAPLRRRHLHLSLLLFALALMSKPMAVSLPVVLLLLDCRPLRRFGSRDSLRRALIEKVPFSLLSIASCVVTVAAQRAGEAMKLTETIPLAARLLVAAQSLAGYLLKLFFPVGLSPLYPYPPLQEISFLRPEFFLPITAAAAFLVLPALRKGTRDAWAVAWGCFIVTLLPVIGIIQVGNQSMADRYTYLPAIAPLLLLSAAAARGMRGRWRPAVAGGAAAAVLLLSLLTVRQITVWKNGVVLWSRVLERSPGASARILAFRNRGAAFARAGDYDRAIEDLSAALALKPGEASTLQNRGVARAKKGDFSGSLQDLEAALSLRKDDPSLFYDRGSTYLAMGDFGRAAGDFTSAISLDDRYLSAYYNRGIASAGQGQLDRAVADFGTVIRLKPDHADAFINRGTALAQKGELPRALEDFDAAVALRPSNPIAYESRGITRYRSGDAEGAREDFRRACGLGSEEGCRLLQAAR